MRTCTHIQLELKLHSQYHFSLHAVRFPRKAEYNLLTVTSFVTPYVSNRRGVTTFSRECTACTRHGLDWDCSVLKELRNAHVAKIIAIG
jgi:hypothetical protein